MSTDSLDVARKFDLTEKLFPFLDRHLIFPLLDFAKSRELYDDNEILSRQYDLLKDTNMTDYLQKLWTELHGADKEVPKDFERKREEAFESLRDLKSKSAKVLELLESQEVKSSLKQDKAQNLEFLESEYDIKDEDINAIYHYGQYQYNCGAYELASDLLYHFRVLSTDSSLTSSATWGKFASDILSLQWDSALEELQKLRDIVDQRSFADPLTQLHHRTWIVHWSLFPFFNAESGKEALCDLLFSSSYISTIQAACPWILRYLTAAVVCTNNSIGGFTSTPSSFARRLKDLIRVVGQERYEYQDPLTEFIRALYIDYDFAEAQTKLSEAEHVIANDLFISGSAEAFLESARYLISELYCRIHQRIDLSQLYIRLNLTAEDGEKWVANLIRESRMDAKIDESEGTVNMNHPATSVYQHVIERTKGLTFRSNQVLLQTLDKKDNVAV